MASGIGSFAFGDLHSMSTAGKPFRKQIMSG
jgi:hypothetical protein